MLLARHHIQVNIYLKQLIVVNTHAIAVQYI